jgi:hypothetical protein
MDKNAIRVGVLVASSVLMGKEEEMEEEAYRNYSHHLTDNPNSRNYSRRSLEEIVAPPSS